MNIDELIGPALLFFGAEFNVFQLLAPIGRKVTFEALEDEADGYRSMLKSVDEIPQGDHIFFREHIAVVRVEKVSEVEDDFKGYNVIDIEDDHLWLKFGTSNIGDWYPGYVFVYHPKAPKV